MSISPLYAASHIFKSSVAKPTADAAHKVQLYLDYDCPFSKKLFNKFTEEVIPALDSKYPGKFEFIFMNVPQPWHPTSTLMHEVAVAVAKLQPQSFWKFSNILFQNQDHFFDTETYNKTRAEIYKDLINLAQSNLDIDGKDIEKLVEIKPAKNGQPSNSGNLIAPDFKYFVRYHRTIGVLVTPTVFVDGISNPSIESSTPVEKVVELFEKIL
ncbi:hypothetical protein PACTADRAFT_47406 [Pachysolen tannophilus NRRL Y-2460]|uniref:Thioredoxin-like fold domain-containing protein n=1 Tax=Pachysolen tannophilus NRRL Y-2460 TaxID=669874 RepID=A0A1E4U0I3_PACTA|nr:hypothetical protein PACTADRAFT_47406 [Pachysolen tannophilus NRRL Y-2460]